MEYYLAMRKNEIWPFAATWIELEGIMLSEISQRKIPYVFTHMWILRNLTDDHGGGAGEKKLQRVGGRQTTRASLGRRTNPG